MRKFATVVWIGILLVMFGLSSNAHAAVISVGGVWSPVVESEINNDGSPYWDGKSYDGDECGIGWLLTNGNCPHAASLGLTGLESLTNGVNGPASFTFIGPVLTGFSFFGEITDWAADGTLEWYDVTNPATTGLIFSGSDGPGAHANPVLPAAWGLKFTSRDGTYLSGDNTNGQFALFRQVTDDEIGYWLGMEDILNVGGPFVSDRDNNDLGTKFVQATDVPEPTSFTLLAFAALFGANRLRRRHQ